MTQNDKFAHIKSVQVHFRYELGHRITVETTLGNMLDAIRTMGSAQCTPDGIPYGGFRFNFETHADFDWSLIGARPWTAPDGAEGVWYEGEFYKKRELEAVDTKKQKMGAAVKYSRGARPTDPEGIVEKADGDIGYVTLAIFRGSGKRNERWARKG